MRWMWIIVASAFVTFVFAVALFSPWTRQWHYRGLWKALASVLIVAAAAGFSSIPILRRCPACGSHDLGEHSETDGAIDFSPAACNACGARLRDR
jgi:hypothetical protein